MASILKVDTIQDQDGNNIINESGNTITIGASGDTVNIVGTLQNGGTNFLQGITEADMWRLTTDHTGNADITNWERVDDTEFGYIGTGLSESSGIFSFPSTGIYLINFRALVTVDAGDTASNISFSFTTDNSTYNARTNISSGNTGSPDANTTDSMIYQFDVTNITTHKFKFATNSYAGSTLRGNTSFNETCFSVIRLGDT